MVYIHIYAVIVFYTEPKEKNISSMKKWMHQTRKSIHSIYWIAIAKRHSRFDDDTVCVFKVRCGCFYYFHSFNAWLFSTFFNLIYFFLLSSSPSLLPSSIATLPLSSVCIRPFARVCVYVCVCVCHSPPCRCVVFRSILCACVCVCVSWICFDF